MKGKKISLYIKSLAIEGGGAEKVFCELCNYLHYRGFQVEVVTLDKPGVSFFYSINSAIKIVFLDNYIKKNSLFSFINIVMKLRHHLKLSSSQINLAFMHSMYIPLSFANIFLGRTVIASEHSHYSYFNNKFLEKVLLIFSKLLVKKIIYVHKKTQKSFPFILRLNSLVITNPINSFKTDFKKNRDKVIISVGSLIPKKRHDIVINAFNLIEKQLKEWSLYIYGEGELKEKLNKEIAKLGLEGRIILKGIRKDITEIYLNSSLFISASESESYGLAVAEALSFGVPVICFEDIDPLKELVARTSGGSAIERDVERLSKEILKLSDPILNQELSFRAFSNMGKMIQNDKSLDNWYDFISKFS